MSMTITRKTIAGKGWPLRNPEDMFAALGELTGQGWTGAVTCEADGWKLRLSADGKQTVNATTGQWLVQDVGLKAVSVAEFGEDYDSEQAVEFPGGQTPAEPEPPAAEPEPGISEDTAVPIVQ